MSDLIDRVALVTGGSRGIGAATAKVLARSGIKVLLTARSSDRLSEIVDTIKSEGGVASFINTDIADYDQAAKAVETALLRYGRLDILINNAGTIAPIANVGKTDPHEWNRCISVNLIGSYNMSRAALDIFLSQGRGVIVNISSGAAFRSLEGWSAYCCSKAAGAMLTQSLHKEYGPSGIRVFGVDPGVVNTDMQATIRASGINPVSKIPVENLSPVDRPAEVISWLCKAAPEDLAGQELHVNDDNLKRRVGT